MLDVNMLLNTGWALLLNGYYPGGEGNGLIIILEIFKGPPFSSNHNHVFNKKINNLEPFINQIIKQKRNKRKRKQKRKRKNSRPGSPPPNFKKSKTPLSLT